MKRRMLALFLALFLGIALTGCADVQSNNGPVSYTHLDVYKRQGKKFWGCSNYPACRYTKNIEEKKI